MKQFRDTNYFISEDGEVFNKRTKGYRKVICKSDRYGYTTVGLYKNGIRTFYTVHRLVAECYLPNSKNKPQVNHINGIKTDNRVSNLEWVSKSENIIHALEKGLLPSGEKSHMSKLKKQDIDFIRQNYQYKSEQYNSKTLAEIFGVCHGTILKIVKNKLWKYENYAS
jgi:hypothetical protein